MPVNVLYINVNGQYIGRHGNAGALASIPISCAGGKDYLIHHASLYSLGTDPSDAQVSAWIERCADALGFAVIGANSLLDFEAVVIDGGAPWVGFALVPRLHAGEVEAAAAIVDERVVTDSGGHRALRVFVRTKLRLAGIQREIEMNLADRCGMRFPLLLGRTALAGAFVVEPGGSYLHRRRRVLRPFEAPRDV